MKLSQAFSFLTALLTAASRSVSAGPIVTCSEQSDCIQFTARKVNDDTVCTDCNCYYEVCMTLSLDGACIKTGTVSHTCVKDPTGCADTPGFLGTKEVGNIADGHTQCQNVPAGGVAEFLLKDGNAKDGCGTDTVSFSSGYTASCETLGVKSCTGNGNIDKECVWRVQAPEHCNKVGGCFGDPHIKRWDQKQFEFHGECDMVLLHSSHVNGDQPLDLHVRTTIRGHFSQIEQAALRVGDSVFQIGTDKFFVDGTEMSDQDLPIQQSEFSVPEPHVEGSAKIYTVVLTDSSTIKFRVLKNFLSVSVSGHEDDFGRSVGLLGNYYTGASLGRDGRLIEDFNEYGMEWQVNEYEPKLFVEDRAPQLPQAKCVMPTEAAVTSRRRLLRNKDEFDAQAERVCRNKEHVEACMEDVLATKDVQFAEAW